MHVKYTTVWRNLAACFNEVGKTKENECLHAAWVCGLLLGIAAACAWISTILYRFINFSVYAVQTGTLS